MRITHPTKKELEAQKRYPTVDQIFATTDLGPLGIPIKSEQWIAQKSHKTHFHLPGKSSPANNSELLYDGSAEARAILKDALERVHMREDMSLEAVGVLTNALDYLKGCFVGGRFSNTKEFFDEPVDPEGEYTADSIKVLEGMAPAEKHPEAYVPETTAR